LITIISYMLQTGPYKRRIYGPRLNLDEIGIWRAELEELVLSYIARNLSGLLMDRICMIITSKPRMDWNTVSLSQPERTSQHLSADCCYVEHPGYGANRG
jgi:hypothetical protein